MTLSGTWPSRRRLSRKLSVLELSEKVWPAGSRWVVFMIMSPSSQYIALASNAQLRANCHSNPTMISSL